MVSYRGGNDDEEKFVPTGPGDPNPAFFGEAGRAANCYAYAVNILRVAAPSINPGELGPKGTNVAAYANDENVYKAACEADGLIYVGRDPSGYLGRTGGYLVAFFKSNFDMHWRRCDSEGVWSEKLPDKVPYRCESQDQASVSIKGMPFLAFYWVQPDVVKLRTKTKKSKGCIIC